MCTSSARWRSLRPPMVFDGEMRHWVRILFAFTRPYLGTAMMTSKAFAVCTYYGGSSRSFSTLTLPAFRSRFSLARAERMSFAFRRAFILCSLVLSGTAAEVSTEAAIGGGDHIPVTCGRKGGRQLFWEIRFDLRLRSKRPLSREVRRSIPDPAPKAPVPGPFEPAPRPADRGTRPSRRRLRRHRRQRTRRHRVPSRYRPCRSPESEPSRPPFAPALRRSAGSRAPRGRRSPLRATARYPRARWHPPSAC